MTSYLDARTLAVRISERKGSETEPRNLGRSPSYRKYRSRAIVAQTGWILQQKEERSMCRLEGKVNRTRVSREASRMRAVCLLAH